MPIGELPAFAVLLGRYRLAVGLTQEELGERASLSARAISDLERGVRRNPHPATVHQLADALRLTPSDLALFEEAARLPAASAVPGRPTGNFLGAAPLGMLVAREDEVARIGSILNAVAAGTGQLLLLSGELGVGKTRLAQELLIAAHRQGFAVGTGRCYQGEQETPYYAVLEALDGLATSAPVTVRAQVERQWEDLQQLIREGTVGNGLESRQISVAVAGLLTTLSEKMPVAILLDDLHWADDGTVQLVHYLARATRGAHVLLFGTFRDARLTEDHPMLAGAIQDLARERLLDRIGVRRLTPEETASLVAAIMGQTQVSEEIASFVYRRTKGNPRLIDQLVRALGGRLQLRREIGAGAMGRVFEAIDSKTGATVAAKLMLSRGETDLNALLRFQQEGAVLAALSHPNIVKIHDTFIEEHASCIIMELIDGPSLGMILRAGRLPLPRAKQLALQIGCALSYAHAQGIVHRDIKPDNIMVPATDPAKVTDFGIARILQPDTSLQTLATTGMRMGTPLYMAPEQIAGKKIDGRTDIYAFGALLFHMITGAPPFVGSDAMSVAVKHLQEEPPLASTRCSDIPADWDALIHKALRKDPARRFQSAAEMEAALTTLDEEVRAPFRTAHVPRWAFAAAPLLILAALLGALWAHSLSPSRASTLSANLDRYFSGFATHQQFSGTVLVARNGVIVLDKGYGLADREHSVRNTLNTEYPVGDVSLGLSIIEIIRLIENHNGVTWDTPICRYFAGCPRSWRQISVRMVLNGTSHINDYGWGRAGNSTQQTLAACQAQPLEGTPGAPTINYFACDSVILATIIERISNDSWISDLSQAIFQPAGMPDMGRMTDTTVSPDHALSYNGSSPDPRRVYNDAFIAYSTTADLYAYDNALFSGKLLSHKDTALLIAPRATGPFMDPGISNSQWAYAWRTGNLFGRRVIYTFGTVNSFQAANLRFPDAGVTVVVLSNDIRDDVLATAINGAAMTFGQPLPPRPPSDLPGSSALVGTYRRIFQDKDRLAAQDTGLNNWVGGAITMTATPSVFHFVVPDGGTVDEYYTAGKDGALTLRGYPPYNQNSWCSPSPSETPPTGSYHWATTKGSLTISRVTFDTCLDRGAALPGQWTKIG